MSTLEALETMKANQILHVIADCPQSFQTVPEEVVKHGYELMREPERAGQDLHFFIRVLR
ncbi:sulfurtransferase TusA family protein [Tumebacillus flagellatus]|uniref:sulfurtransferase TusA family protein n=1 Tax=Tumebacillus flagellatus TaxID=1157490 RepID=UPI002378C9DE|nr:sulfurtransferase TusA family protein [Tumebacillus flagellatus]